MLLQCGRSPTAPQKWCLESKLPKTPSPEGQRGRQGRAGFGSRGGALRVPGRARGSVETKGDKERRDTEIPSWRRCEKVPSRAGGCSCRLRSRFPSRKRFFWLQQGILSVLPDANPRAGTPWLRGSGMGPTPPRATPPPPQIKSPAQNQRRVSRRERRREGRETGKRCPLSVREALLAKPVLWVSSAGNAPSPGL